VGTLIDLKGPARLLTTNFGHESFWDERCMLMAKYAFMEHYNCVGGIALNEVIAQYNV